MQKGAVEAPRIEEGKAHRVMGLDPTVYVVLCCVESKTKGYWRLKRLSCWKTEFESAKCAYGAGWSVACTRWWKMRGSVPHLLEAIGVSGGWPHFCRPEAPSPCSCPLWGPLDSQRGRTGGTKMSRSLKLNTLEFTWLTP